MLNLLEQRQVATKDYGKPLYEVLEPFHYPARDNVCVSQLFSLFIALHEVEYALELSIYGAVPFIQSLISLG